MRAEKGRILWAWNRRERAHSRPKIFSVNDDDDDGLLLINFCASDLATAIFLTLRDTHCCTPLLRYQLSAIGYVS